MNRPRRLVPYPGGELELGPRTVIMGVVNVTPDSFSDGGHFYGVDDAVRQGLQLAAEGAGILDIGGESTRPGSDPVPAAEEMDRVIPVIERLAKQCDALISIDTNKAEVAKAAMNAGAHIINDITALMGDKDMASVAADTGAALVLMHMKGTPRTMQTDPVYDDVVAEVGRFLEEQAQVAMDAGVAREKIIIDPGIGFGKTVEHNLSLIGNLGKLAEMGYPVLLGASRKAFIGVLTGKPVEDRLWGTVGVHVVGAAMGADIVRVHDVAPLKDALIMSDAIVAAEAH